MLRKILEKLGLGQGLFWGEEFFPKKPRSKLTVGFGEKPLLTNEEKSKLKLLAETQFESEMEAMIAVAKILGSCCIPTHEIVYIYDKEVRTIARLNRVGNKYQWLLQ